MTKVANNTAGFCQNLMIKHFMGLIDLDGLYKNIVHLNPVLSIERFLTFVCILQW
jgi:hypothetical protein